KVYERCLNAGEYVATTRSAPYGPLHWWASDPWKPTPVEEGIQEDLRVRFERYLPDPLPDNSKLTEYGEIGVRREGIHQRVPISIMQQIKTVEELREYPWPDWDQPWRWTGLKERVAEDKERGRLVIGVTHGPVFGRAQALRGAEQLLVDFATDSPMAHFLVERLTQIEVVRCRQLAGLGIDMLGLGDDIGSSHGLMMSPDTWRKWLKPGIAAMMEEARGIDPDIIGAYHSDGDISEIISDLIDLGIRQINPVEPEIANMNPERLKRNYGRNLVLNGTMSTGTLIRGSISDVREEVISRMNTAKKHGGVVIRPCSMPVEMSLENLSVFLETAEKECVA
ncbi:uroporphyrinogen decarboxylase family protein, partial [Candidatus Latescibacterota bacterium]